MDGYLKQATTVTVPIGPFVTSDGTAVTGLTVSIADVRLYFNGASAVSKIDTLTCAHSQDGWYLCEFNHVDTSALGMMQVAVVETGTLQIWHNYAVITANQWDAMFGADYYDVNLVADQSGATIGTVNELSSVAVVKTVNDFSATATAAIGVAVWAANVSANNTAETFGKTFDDMIEDDGGATYRYTAAALTNAPTGGSGDATVAAAVWSNVSGASVLNTTRATNLNFPISHVTAVGVASVVNALSTVGTVGVCQSLTTVGTVQSLSSITSVTDIGSVADIVDAAWDEGLTGASHNVATSAGKRLRAIDAAFEVASGTAQSGTTTTMTIASTESSTNDIFNGDRIVVVAGTGIGEHGIVIAYVGATKVATVSKAWIVTPDGTSEYSIIPADADVEAWNSISVVGDGTMAQASVVAGIAQASSIAAIGPAKNVELANFKFFMVAASDHITPATSETVVGYICKDNENAFTSLTNSVAEISSYGAYIVTIAQAEMNADTLMLVFTAAGADQVGINIITT